MKEKLRLDILIIISFTSCIVYMILLMIVKYVNKGVLG